jgi:hypothetical protein
MLKFFSVEEPAQTVSKEILVFVGQIPCVSSPTGYVFVWISWFSYINLEVYSIYSPNVMGSFVKVLHFNWFIYN